MLISLLMEKGVQFSLTALTMVPGIPIKPMLAKYVTVLFNLSWLVFVEFRKIEVEQDSWESHVSMFAVNFILNIV